MSSETQDLNVQAGRNRRNVLKMGAFFGSVALTGVESARGQSVSTISPVAVHHCLLRGARVLTAKGECKVEDLAIGDLVPTMFGGVQPIQWIGHYPIKRSNPSEPWPKDACPVRIARSALAANVPRTDLYVTQAHALFVDDVLVSAGCLVNETTITLYEARELNDLEFFHIKLKNHDVIYAEGAPVETLLDVDESATNFAEYFRMYGAPTIAEAPCLPILSNRRMERGFKSRFRSAMSWFDRRKRIGVIRNRLEERAIALSQELEPSF
jgi:hypothetical protein